MIPDAKSYDEQVEILRSRGLVISDHDGAKQCLAHLNYYRLQLYSHAFLDDGENKRFRKGIRIEDILELYAYDQKLRGLTLAASKIIEVSVRSRLAYVMGHRLGPTGYLDTTNYRSLSQAIKTLDGVRSEVARSREPFLLPFNSSDDGMNALPIWIAVEAFSFGSTSKIYANLADIDIQREVADTYALNEVLMVPALHHLNTARNMVAHHAQFWNLRIQEKLKVPNKEPSDLRQSLQQNADAPGCYNTLTLLMYLVQKISPGNPLAALVREHIGNLRLDLAPRAGIPDDWKIRPVWKAT